MRDVTAAFRTIERKSAKMGLAVNEGKTKYILSTRGDVPRMGSQITANSYSFDVVKEFMASLMICTGYRHIQNFETKIFEVTAELNFERLLLYLRI